MLSVGHYVDQLHAWLDHVPSDGLFVAPSVAFADVLTERAAVDELAAAVLRRARIPPNATGAPRTNAKSHALAAEASTYVKRTGDALDDVTRRRLRTYYAPYDARLFDYLAQHPANILPRDFAITADPKSHWW